jgi:thioredoxin reductase
MEGHVMLKGSRPRLAIIGAGPIGLEAALYAAHLGFPFTVYERGDPGHNVRQWGHVKLFTPWGQNTTPLGRDALLADQPRLKLPDDAHVLTGREWADQYLTPLALHPQVVDHVRTSTTVVQVARSGHLKEEAGPSRAREPFRLLVRGPDCTEANEEADVVLDCSGTYGNARYLGDGGILALGELAARQHITFGLEDVLGEKAVQYADRTVVVVGSGHSAATTAVMLAQLAAKYSSTWIVWLGRGPGSTPLKRIVNDPLRERDQLAARANMLATRGEGHVEYHSSAIIKAVQHKGKEGFRVVARCGGEEKSWEADRVIANVGYEPDRRLYSELQISEHVETFAPTSLKQPEPGFFILGAKSQGRSSHFLLARGFEQVREAFALLAGQPGLDLYKKPRAVSRG